MAQQYIKNEEKETAISREIRQKKKPYKIRNIKERKLDSKIHRI